MFFRDYEYCDPFNIERGRNAKNSDKEEYNCAGYALGCFSWYCPFNNHEANLEKNVKKILRDFSNVRVVSLDEKLCSNEYLVAFRIGNSDFHFMKRSNKSGVWYEKRGSRYELRKVKKENVFNDIWLPERYDGGYCSEIVFFAVKEI